MILTAGVRIGSFELESPIGIGGMGEVWKARDVALNRDVALRILPEPFSDDPHRLARFEREATVLTSLHHPSIAAFHGFEGGNGDAVLVFELVEGPTLADRISEGSIPVEEALPIAKHIAEAVEAAHHLGIIHRDLKPSNVKLLKDDAVKVIDFGLAQIFEPEPIVEMHGSQNASRAAKLMAATTGTAAYMSPEQARGEPLSTRSDIWAFGCVLYEMLTGRQAFEGEDISLVLSGVLETEPEWTALPAITPSAVRELLRRCLDKNPRTRLQNIADAWNTIAHAVGSPSTVVAPASEAKQYRHLDLPERLGPHDRKLVRQRMEQKWTYFDIPRESSLPSDESAEGTIARNLRRLTNLLPGKKRHRSSS